MYVARIIGMGIEVKSEDMLEAYNVASEFAPTNSKISIKFVPNK